MVDLSPDRKRQWHLTITHFDKWRCWAYQYSMQESSELDTALLKF